MERFHAFDAFKFGFRALIKNPLLFLMAYIYSQILWIFGVFISFLIVYPFFMPIIELVYRIIDLIKKVFVSGLFGGLLGGGSPFKGLGKITEGASSIGGIFGEVVEKTAGGVGKIAGGVGEAVGGVGKIATKGFGLLGQGTKLLALYSSAKEIIAELANNPQFFLLFLMGLFLFSLLLKMLYDLIVFGWIRFSLKYYDASTSSIKSFFCKPLSLLKYAIATSVFSLIIILPYFLMGVFYLIPSRFLMFLGDFFAFGLSLYLICKLWFYSYFIADKNYDVVESLRASWVVPGTFLNISMLLLLLSASVLVGLLLMWLLPAMIALPIAAILVTVFWLVTWPAFAYLYRKLTVQKVL